MRFASGVRSTALFTQSFIAVGEHRKHAKQADRNNFDRHDRRSMDVEPDINRSIGVTDKHHHHCQNGDDEDECRDCRQMKQGF